MNITEKKGLEAIEVMADMMIPLTSILSDAKVKEAKDKTIAEMVTVALKRHPKDCLDVLVACFGDEANEYNAVQMFSSLLTIFADPSMQDLFIGQVQEG